MKIVIGYVAVTNGPHTADLISRFVGSYLVCPPGLPHELIVLCNGGPLPMEQGLMLDAIGARFMPRVNDPGWDISAFQDLAKSTDADILVCFGESVYFHRPNWLNHIVHAWNQHGEGMYGFFSSHLLRPHLNTTAFATAPKFLRQYAAVKSHPARYEFEHGENSFWRALHAWGVPVRLVTWDGSWQAGQWRYPKNILWRGTQENCLVFCNHTDRYSAASVQVKANWARGADNPQPFR